MVELISFDRKAAYEQYMSDRKQVYWKAIGQHAEHPVDHILITPVVCNTRFT